MKQKSKCKAVGPTINLDDFDSNENHRFIHLFSGYNKFFEKWKEENKRIKEDIED